MSFKIILYSDWHLGITKDKTIVRAFNEIKEHKPDLVVNAGDNNGGWYGAKATHTILMRHREVMPDVPTVAVLGNHEHWVRGRKARFNGDVFGRSYGRPSFESWRLNYQDIIKTMQKFSVHFLDLDGPWRSPEHPGIAVVGHTMWYEKADPPTNDLLHMPYHVDGDTHAYMRRNAYREVLDSLDKLTDQDTTRIFVSHFPVIDASGDTEFAEYSSSKVFGENLKETFGISKFLCGHAHQRHEGPLRFEAGSQYGKPRFLILEISGS
jgi:hypothetical protein